MIKRFCFSIIILICTSCLSQEFSVKQKILEEKFYGYLLNEEAETELSLTAQIISPHDEWDLPCQYPGPESPWNPLRVRYFDADSNRLLEIELADRNVIWSHNHESREGKLEWKGQIVNVLISEENPHQIKFVDRIGNELTISGDANFLSEREFFELVQQLEFIGLNESEFLDPWSAEWCDQWSRKKLFYW